MPNSSLKIVYMGTPEFAVPGLEALLKENYNIVGVVTVPDKPQGRGLKTTFSPVKEFAVRNGLKVLQPEKLKDEAFIEELKALKADLQIVVAFRMLPEVVWNMPPKGTFNLHSSLLPQYRGAAPIHWAVMNGEKETGITTFFLKHEIDTGDLILQESEPISETDTTGEVYERLMHKGAGLIVKTVQLIENDAVKPIPQQANALLKTAPKIFKEHCKIDFQKPAEEIYNFVRGLNPFPTAYCMLNGSYCKIHKVSYNVKTKLQVGSFAIDANGKSLTIGTGKGEINIIELQPEGKRKMEISEFLRGHKVESVE